MADSMFLFRLLKAYSGPGVLEIKFQNTYWLRSSFVIVDQYFLSGQDWNLRQDCHL